MKLRNRLSQLRKMCGPFIRPFAFLSFLVICVQVTLLGATFWTGKFVESVSVKDASSVWHNLCYVGLFVFIGQLLQWLMARLHINEIIFDLDGHMSTVTLDRITRFSLGQVTNENSGFKQETLKKGEAAISELMQTVFMELVPSLVRMVTTVGALFFVSWQVGLIVLACISSFVFVSILMTNRLMPSVKENRKKEAKISTAYWEVIKNLRLVISSGQQRRAQTEFDGKYAEYGLEGKAIWTGYVFRSICFREQFAFVGQIGAYGTAAWLVMHEKMPLGTLVIVIGWCGIAFGALNYIGSIQRRLIRNFNLVGRYFDLLDIPPAIVSPSNPIRIESLGSGIEIRGVSFVYPDLGESVRSDDVSAKERVEKPAALHNVSLTVPKGSVVALVGASGSGKSTLVNLLQRAYDPDSGEIVVGGHRLTELDPDHWRGKIGIVHQEPQLWDGTLRYNITYGLNPDVVVSDEELERVAKIARIDEFRPRLEPDGFDTLIGEAGIKLSGGQRQRVAIARAIIKNPSLLILDEATNALDPANEKHVHAAIRKALEGRTGIIIAHRLSTIRNADKIAVFDKGRIVDTGTHDELLGRCEVYRGLVEHEIAAC